MTHYTGFFRPRRQLPFRAIAFTPGLGMMIGAGTMMHPPVAPGAGMASDAGMMMPPPAAGMTMMQVLIPAGASPGQMLQVQGPQNQTVQVRIPEGMSPGQPIQVQVPHAQPVMVGTVVPSA